MGERVKIKRRNIVEMMNRSCPIHCLSLLLLCTWYEPSTNALALVSSETIPRVLCDTSCPDGKEVVTSKL